MNRYILFILFLFTIHSAIAQRQDSAANAPIIPLVVNTTQSDSAKGQDTTVINSRKAWLAGLFATNDTKTSLISTSQWNKQPLILLMQEKPVRSKDQLFYFLVLLTLFLGFIKVIFSKYFENVFTLVFQASFRQIQTREQLLQDSLPSVLMNLFFVLVTATFVTVIAAEKHWVGISFWECLLYSTVVLTCIYTVKYLFLQFAGWVFGVQQAAEHYLFIVFLINKILGVALLPLLLLNAFATGTIFDIVSVAGASLIGILLFYRYILSFSTLWTSLHISPFHFFVYLCAVEIIPFFLIYKVLFDDIGLSV